jgi:hypothetical protein
MRLWLALLSLLIPNALELSEIDPHNLPCLLTRLHKAPDWQLAAQHAGLNQTSLEELAPYAPVFSSGADIMWWWCVQGLAVYSRGGHPNLCVQVYVGAALLPLPLSEQSMVLQSGVRQSLQHWLTESGDRCGVCLPMVPAWVLPSSNTCHWHHAPKMLEAITSPAVTTPHPFLPPQLNACPPPAAAGAAAATAAAAAATAADLAAGPGDIVCPAIDWDWPWKALGGVVFGVFCIVFVVMGSALRLTLLAVAGAVYGWGTVLTRLASGWRSFPGADQGSLSRRAGLYLRAALLGAWDNLRGYLVWCLVQYLVPEVVVSLGCLVLLVTGLVDPISMLMKHLVTSILVALGLAKLRFGPRLLGVMWWMVMAVVRPAAAFTRPVWSPIVVRLAPVVTPPAMAAWQWVMAHVMRGPVLTICIDLQRSLSWAAGGEDGPHQDVWQDAADAAAADAGHAVEEDPNDDLGEDLAAEDGQLLEAYSEALQRDVPDWPHGQRDQSTVTCRVCGGSPGVAGSDVGGVGTKVPKFLVCPQCSSPQDSYCSVACMEEDWPRHRRTCQPPLAWTESL